MTLTLLVTVLPANIFAEGSSPDGIPDGNLDESLNIDTVYYEVSFGLPEGIDGDETDTVSLPETVMLPKGTLIYAIEEPGRADYRFAGWYYDAALTLPAEGGDAIDRNLTLYPSFEPLINDTDVRLNYISNEDVEPDFAVEIISYGLNEAEIQELLKVTNLSKVNGTEEYVLSRVEPDVYRLIPDAQLRGTVMELIRKAQANELPETLMKTLNALTVEGTETPALEQTVINELIDYYAPAEMETTAAMQAADILNRVQTAGLDPTNVTLTQLIGIMTDEELKEAGLMNGINHAEADRVTLNLEEEFADLIADLPVSHYFVRPANGRWNRGDLHQTEILDTTSLRFFRDGEATSQYVVYYNITVHQDEFNNMKLNSGVVFLPFAEVEGVTLDQGLYMADAAPDSGTMEIAENIETGVMTYSGAAALTEGMTVAVYDGILNPDGTVNGSVGYFTITGIRNGGQYAYRSADFTEVVSLPEIIPVRDDGSFSDGEIFLTDDQLDFGGELYGAMGLNENTVIEPGDFLAVYSGDIEQADEVSLSGYGYITAVERTDNGLTVRYNSVSEDTLMQSGDMFMQIDQIDLPMTDEERNEVGRLVEKDVLDSGFLEDSADYIGKLITEPEKAILPDSRYAGSLKEISFQREDGGKISLDEVRQLAGGAKVKVEWPPKLSFAVGEGLQHFDGTGARAELAAEMTITITMKDEAEIKIGVVAMIEVEVALGLKMKWEIEWRKFAKIIPYPYDVSGTVGLHAGIYTGVGITVTVQTGSGDDDDAKLSDTLDSKTSGMSLNKQQNDAVTGISKLGDKIQNMANLAKWTDSDALGISHIPGTKDKKTGKTGKGTTEKGKQEMHDSVGGGFEDKYANFIQESDAEYVTLVNKSIGSWELPVDPLHIVALGLDINFVVKFKLNVMLGASLTYANAKELSVSFTVLHPSSESNSGDLETPNFQVDFFIFGMAGIRVGLEFDFKIGVVSTKIASLGVSAEVGVYLEFYGFFYVAYKWESGSGSSSEMFGSLLLQFGAYLDVNFNVQAGNKALQKSIDIYDLRVPILSLGNEYCALDFEIEEDDEKLNLVIEAEDETNKDKKSTATDVIGGVSIKVPDELFSINFLELDTGDTDSDNMDSNIAVGEGTSFTAWGSNYVQMNELNFRVEFEPKGKDFADATEADKAKGGFLYDPVNNTIYAKPNSAKDTDLWGEFTFTYCQGGSPKKKTLGANYGAGFGLNTREISRTVKIHWTGKPVTGVADVYLPIEHGKELPNWSDEIGEVTFANAKDYYMLKETISFDGIDGIAYYMNLNGLADRYPGYRLIWAKEPYDPMAMTVYAARVEKGESTLFAELMRTLCYELPLVPDDLNSRGWLNIMQSDRNIYFMMHAPETRVDLYFNVYQTETDWYILNESAKSSSPLAVSRKVAITAGSNAFENMPESIRAAQTGTDTVEYTWYMFSYQDNTLNNLRVRSTGEIVRPSDIPFYDRNLYEENSTGMPAFADFINDRSKWIPVTEGTVVPLADTVFFAIRAPKKYKITWKYDDGDRITEVKYNTWIQEPVPARRKGYEFDKWVDAKGNEFKKLSRMPAHDLVLYPEFIGQKHRVTWILNGQQKYSFVNAGTSPLNSCPFTPGDYSFMWMTERGDMLTSVADEYRMPDNDITLYGEYISRCDWTLYEADSGRYTGLDSEYRYQEYLTEGNVLQSLPEAIRAQMKDKQYTYSCYRSNAVGSEKVDADRGNWTVVDENTQFRAGNGTYIVRRDPITAKVIWKYDDGDVSTEPWIGSKLTAPKEINRRGFVLTGWADADGVSYEYPPTDGVTLYPQFVEHEHSWDNGKVTEPATCTTAGVMTYTCTDCDKTRTEEIKIDPANHAGGTEIRDKKDASCTAEGYSGDIYCKGCGMKIGVGLNTARLPHTPVTDTGYAATCTEDGLTDGSHCQICDAVIQKQEVIPATGHAWGEPEWRWNGYTSAKATFTCANDPAHPLELDGTVSKGNRTEPTCTSDGSQVYQATVTFEGQEYTDSKTEVLPAIDHVWKEKGGRTAKITNRGDNAYTVSLKAGKATKECEACHTTEYGETDYLVPVGEMTLSLEELFSDAAWSSVADCSLPDGTATVTVDEIDGVDGGPMTLTYPVTAAYEWAEDYSTLTKQAMQEQFEQDSGYEYTFSAIVRAVPGSLSDPTFYGAHKLSGGFRVMVESDAGSFITGTAVITVSGHKHDWVKTGGTDHTDTEAGSIDYECSICYNKKHEDVPAGHDWELDQRSSGIATLSTQGTAGAMQATDGNWYTWEAGSDRYVCTLCGQSKDEPSQPIFSLSYIWPEKSMPNWGPTLTDLISAGIEKLSDIDPAAFCQCLLPTQDAGGTFIELIVPGTYRMSSDLTGDPALTDLRSDPDFIKVTLQFTFTPDHFTAYAPVDPQIIEVVKGQPPLLMMAPPKLLSAKPTPEPAEPPAPETSAEPTTEPETEATPELTEETPPESDDNSVPEQTPEAPLEETAEPESELTPAPIDETTPEPTSEFMPELSAESEAESTPEIFTGSVRVKLLNQGDIHEGDTLEFKAIITGDKSLVNIS